MNDSTAIAGEEVLWTGSVSHFHYLGRWLLALLLLAALAASFVYPLPISGTTESALWILRGGLILIAFVLIVSIAIARARRKYRITNHRVGVEFGLVSKNSNEIRIEHIRSINLATSGLLGLFGVGRLEFSSAATDDAEVIFWNVPRAAHLRDLVRSLEIKTA